MHLLFLLLFYFACGQLVALAPFLKDYFSPLNCLCVKGTTIVFVEKRFIIIFVCGFLGSSNHYHGIVLFLFRSSFIFFHYSFVVFFFLILDIFCYLYILVFYFGAILNAIAFLKMSNSNCLWLAYRKATDISLLTFYIGNLLYSLTRYNIFGRFFV